MIFSIQFQFDTNQRIVLWVKKKPATRESRMTKGKELELMKNTMNETESYEGLQFS